MNKDNIILSKLSLQNFATFKRQSISFSKGLNIIIGETGSGKSLIFDALQIILGQRANKNLVRSNTKFATIEVFLKSTGTNVSNFLDEIGYPSDDGEIVLKRIIYTNGKTKSFINYQQCNLSTLQYFSKKYIDLVGQFENQKLLSSNYQLKLLDAYSGNKIILKKYYDEFSKYKDLLKKKELYHEKREAREQRLDYLDFQINEIKEVSPQENEEIGLIEKKNRILKSKEKLDFFEKIQFLYYNSEISIQSQLSKMKKIIESSSEFIKKEERDLFENSFNALQDFGYRISNISDESNELEIEKVIDRLDKFQKLKRKFGPTIENVILNFQDFKLEKKDLLNISENLEKTNALIEDSLNRLVLISNKLSSKRKSSSILLGQDLTKSIQKLNMSGAQIKVKIEKSEEFGKTGQDHIFILAETNPGEGFFPIKKIASGGELSRILLSIRQLLVSDSISIFLFDEVDTGIGGETALLIGKSLKDVASKSQVIAISHLPQIAIQADAILKVQKNTTKIESEVRTISQILEITNTAQIKKESRQMTPLS